MLVILSRTLMAPLVVQIIMTCGEEVIFQHRELVLHARRLRHNVLPATLMLPMDITIVKVVRAINITRKTQLLRLLNQTNVDVRTISAITYLLSMQHNYWYWKYYCLHL